MRFPPKYTTCAKGLYYHIPLPSFLYVWLFNSQDLISNSPYCLPNDSHYVSLENFGIGSISNPTIDISLHSHHLSEWCCIEIVERNYVLVTCGSKGVNWWWRVLFRKRSYFKEVNDDNLRSLILKHLNNQTTFFGSWFVN